MRTEHNVRKLITQLYHDLGEDPARLKSIKPVGGDWASAIAYEIIRDDGAVVHVQGKDIDEANEPQLAEVLGRFRK
jgi:hypothetical protein